MQWRVTLYSLKYRRVKKSQSLEATERQDIFLDILSDKFIDTRSAETGPNWQRYVEQFVGKRRCTKIQSTTLKNKILDLYNLSVNRHMLKGG